MKKIVRGILAAALLALPMAAADITGTWTITGDVVGNPVNMKCTFTQQEAKITGSCVVESRGNSPTTGQVDGDKVTFQHSVGEYDLTYTGTLDTAGTSMKGDIAVAGVSGTFSGTKEAPAK